MTSTQTCFEVFSLHHSASLKPILLVASSIVSRKIRFVPPVCKRPLARCRFCSVWEIVLLYYFVVVVLLCCCAGCTDVFTEHR